MRKPFVSATNTLLLLMTIIFVSPVAPAREKLLYEFPGGKRGNDPQSGVVFDSKGNAYGTTYYGGTYGWGTVYELEYVGNGWKEQVIYNFAGIGDGTNPVGNLLIDGAGNLYGTTLYGGTGTGCSQENYGCGGTAFELQHSKVGWKHIVLHSFCLHSGCSDGSAPSGLTFDEAGNLYGTTVFGGHTCFDDGCGTVYKLSHSNGSWTLKVLHAFDANGDGYYPAPGIAIDKSGRLYGTTCCGGGTGYGIVFMLKRTKRGWKEVMVYQFTGSAEDEYPNGNLIIHAHGNLYGSTSDTFNGCNYDCGTIYKLRLSKGTWVKSVVYAFDGPHGASPDSLLLDKAGHFYGSTLLGGTYNAGTIFELKPEEHWKIEILYNFTGQRGDANPNPGLSLGSDSALYGTTPDTSGQYDGGVFEVSP